MSGNPNLDWMFCDQTSGNPKLVQIQVVHDNVCLSVSQLSVHLDRWSLVKVNAVDVFDHTLACLASPYRPGHGTLKRCPLCLVSGVFLSLFLPIDLQTWAGGLLRLSVTIISHGY